MLRVEPVDGVKGPRLLAALGVAATLAAAAGLITAYALPAVAPAWGGADRLAAVIVAEVYVAIIVGHVIAFRGWRRTREALQLTSASAGQILTVCAASAAALVVAAVMYVVLSPWLWSRTYVTDAFMWIGADGGRLATNDPVLFVVSAGRAVMLAPIAEEMLFRGSLFGWIRGRLTAPLAILITASLFALAHPLPVLWLGAFCFGLVAAWSRERFSSLTPSIIAHLLVIVGLIVASYAFTGWNVKQMM